VRLVRCVVRRSNHEVRLCGPVSREHLIPLPAPSLQVSGHPRALGEVFGYPVRGRRFSCFSKVGCSAARPVYVADITSAYPPPTLQAVFRGAEWSPRVSLARHFRLPTTKTTAITVAWRDFYALHQACIFIQHPYILWLSPRPVELENTFCHRLIP
jgi:hypothetical protein